MRRKQSGLSPLSIYSGQCVIFFFHLDDIHKRQNKKFLLISYNIHKTKYINSNNLFLKSFILFCGTSFGTQNIYDMQQSYITPFKVHKCPDIQHIFRHSIDKRSE